MKLACRALQINTLLLLLHFNNSNIYLVSKLLSLLYKKIQHEKIIYTFSY
jgi:hypothetical protein